VTHQPQRNHERFYTYPMHRMVAIVDDDAALDAVLRELQKTGVDLADVTVLTGPDGARLLDRRGERHGLLGRLLRIAQWSASENDDLDLHAEALQEGRSVVYVPARDDQRKAAVASALRGAGGHALVYFGRWTTEKRWL
jgi:sugar/nucleoside kinase (ribokinase family)